MNAAEEVAKTQSLLFFTSDNPSPFAFAKDPENVASSSAEGNTHPTPPSLDAACLTKDDEIAHGRSTAGMSPPRRTGSGPAASALHGPLETVAGVAAQLRTEAKSNEARHGAVMVAIEGGFARIEKS